MSIQSEITRLNDAKTVLKNWLTSQSVQTAVNANLTAIAEIIAQLELGGSMETLSGTINILTLEDGIYYVENGSIIDNENWYEIDGSSLAIVKSTGLLIVNSRLQNNVTIKTGVLFANYLNSDFENNAYAITYFESDEFGKVWYQNSTPLYKLATTDEIKDELKPTTYNVTGSATNVTTAEATTIATLKIPAGTYIINAHVNFASNATGVRKIYIGTQADYYSNTRALADNRRASSHQATMSNISTILNVEAETTYYLNVYQNSGSSLTCNGSLRALRIGDYVEYQSGL